MKKNMIWLVVLLVAATLIFAGIHLSQQEQIECMQIRSGDKTVTIYPEDLDQTDFSGTLIDGKGTVTEHTYRGVELKVLLAQKGITLAEGHTVSVTSADNYTAEYTAEEILTDGGVYIAIEEDGAPIEGMTADEIGLQLVIFGDPNSRRCVRNAKMVEITN